MKNLYTLLLGLFIISISFSIASHEYKAGEIIIDYPIARETPPGVKVGAGYLTITNGSSKDDKLISAFGSISPIIQVHSMTVENNLMRMQEIKGGLVIPAGESISLNPGGIHFMFLNLTQQLKEGEQYTVNLVFEKAGKIEVTFNVERFKLEEHSKHGINKTKEHSH